MSRYVQVMVGYAVIHVVGWLGYAKWPEVFGAPPSREHSLLLAFCLTWASEKK